jgi:S-disulfanyl-L-cysteine oxidoreductase SoxD
MNSGGPNERRLITKSCGRLGLLVAAALGIAAFGAWLRVAAPATSGAHFADADDSATVMLGKKIYLGHCASCHGRNLQGQPLWQLIDEYVGRRAPAHDETGHTWQHSDEDIFYMIKYGRFPSMPDDIVSFMPAFDGVLGDREILSVMAFIKARWPIGLRASQAMLNPGRAGMPWQAGAEEWRLPPTCNVLLRRRAATTTTTNTDAPLPEAQAFQGARGAWRPTAYPRPR